MAEEYKWNNDKFSKMVKENYDKVIKLSDKVCASVVDQLMSSDEVNKLTNKTNKKKLNKQINNSFSFYAGASRYFDAPLAVLAAGEDSQPQNENQPTPQPDSSKNDSKPEKRQKNKYKLDEDVTLTKEQMQYAFTSLGKQKWDALKEQMGSNLKNMVFQFLSNGPGLTDFTLFNGTFDVIVKPLDDDLSKDMFNFYENNRIFSQSYNALVKAFSTSNANMSNTLDKINNIIATGKDVNSTDSDALHTYIAVIKFVTMIIYNNVLRPRIKKAFNNSTNNPKIYDSLVAFYNAIQNINGREYRSADNNLNFKGLQRIATQVYPNTVAARVLNGTNAIAALYLIISTAIAKGKMNMDYNLSESHEDYNNNQSKLNASYAEFDNVIKTLFGNMAINPNDVKVLQVNVQTAKIDGVTYIVKKPKNSNYFGIYSDAQNNKAIFAADKEEWNAFIKNVVKKNDRLSIEYQIIEDIINDVSKTRKPEEFATTLAENLKNYYGINKEQTGLIPNKQ